MTLISAHSGLSRKLVTLTEEIRVCKRAPNKSSHLTRTVVSNVRLDESWSRRRDLNPRPTDYKSVALPTELRRPERKDEGEGMKDEKLNSAIAKDTTSSKFEK